MGLSRINSLVSLHDKTVEPVNRNKTVAVLTLFKGFHKSVFCDIFISNAEKCDLEETSVQ